MDILQPSQSQLLVKSPTEGSLVSHSRYETVPKRRTLMKKKGGGEVIQQIPTVVRKRSNSRLTLSDLSQKTLTQSQTTFNLLDLVPVDDPIWTDIIPSEIQEDPSFNLEKLLNENQEYFTNLLGLALQERQLYKIQDSKFSFPLKKFTTYNTQFKVPINYDDRKFDAKIYETPLPKNQMASNTQYDTAFKQPKLHSQDNFKPVHVKDTGEMTLLTSYKQDFFDWKAQKSERVGPSRNVSTGSLPMLTKTSYQDSFKLQTLGEQYEPTKKKLLYNYPILIRGPFAQGSSMIYKESYSKSQYPQHRIEEKTQRQKQPDYEQAPTYDGQYRTTFRKYQLQTNSSFNQKLPDSLIQDRYWKQKLMQRIIERRN